MNAVFRLNLMVSLMFVIALAVTLYFMLEQATKDINREVLSSVRFNHRLLTVAADNDRFLNDLLVNPTRHVRISLLSPDELPLNGPGSESHVSSDEIPSWFADLIPGIKSLEEKQYFRYMANGQVLRLQADSSDELEEVWESVQQIFILFLLSAILSNTAIYFGVKRGIKPVSDFLSALNQIQKGQFKARLKEYSIKEINTLSKHFNKMAQALENAENDNKKLTQQLITIQEKERAHLARELHDDLGQYLTGIQAQAYIIEKKAEDANLVSQIGQQIVSNCIAMQKSFRQLIRDLHPVILEQLGLKDALKNLIDNWSKLHQLKVSTFLPEEWPDLTDEDNTHIYRVLQESLNNISKHAQATQVVIRITYTDHVFSMLVTDNGQGLKNFNTSGLGMRSMQERANCLNAKLKVLNNAEGGCTVKLKLSVNRSAV